MRFDGILKRKLQAFGPSELESLQSQSSLQPEKRLPIMDLAGSSRPTREIGLRCPGDRTVHGCTTSVITSPSATLLDRCRGGKKVQQRLLKALTTSA